MSQPPQLTPLPRTEALRRRLPLAACPESTLMSEYAAMEKECIHLRFLLRQIFHARGPLGQQFNEVLENWHLEQYEAEIVFELQEPANPPKEVGLREYAEAAVEAADVAAEKTHALMSVLMGMKETDDALAIGESWKTQVKARMTLKEELASRAILPT